MTDRMRVTLEDNKITVANPDTGFWVSYDTHPHSPYLILTDTGLNWTGITPEVSQFRAKAFQAAVAKARELGWID
jgi:hypothetical protein